MLWVAKTSIHATLIKQSKEETEKTHKKYLNFFLFNFCIILIKNILL